MTITLYAQPYDISACGFSFSSFDDYAARVAVARNEAGNPVEEFDIQFIDGEAIDCALAAAIGLSQANIKAFFEIVEEWNEFEKRIIIIAVGECGYSFEPGKTVPEDFDLEIYPCDSMRDFASSCIEDGWFGEIPEILAPYIDLDAIARDLAMEYAEITIAGEHVVYRCA